LWEIQTSIQRSSDDKSRQLGHQYITSSMVMEPYIFRKVRRNRLAWGKVVEKAGQLNLR
jgi:hypothetical protein